MGEGRLAGLRVNMKGVLKEFREVHCFRVYWRSGFYGGEGVEQSQVGTD